METFIIIGNRCKRCRLLKIFLIVMLVMFCALYFQTPEKPQQILLQKLDRIVDVDLKKALVDFMSQIHHPTNSSLKYLIDTKKCRIPNLDVMNAEVKPYFEVHDYQKCREKPLLTYITKENNIAKLHINHRYSSYYEYSVCCYSEVTPVISEDYPDSEFGLSSCKPFSNSVTLKEDVIYVMCMDEQHKTVYKQVHAVMTIDAQVKKKLKSQHTIEAKPFNVLIVGIDSISRLHLTRSMPKTQEFLKKNQWIEFKAYNKVGLNTFPNLMALLTGRNESNVFSDCVPDKLGGLDNCNIIWYDYSKHNYVTAYAEDEATISTFNYLKKGFAAAPTDYYFRSYILATEKCLDLLRVDGLIYCTGLETAGERILNLASEFSNMFKNSSYFGFFWMNSFSHNSFNGGSRMDEKLVDFFKHANKTRALANTIVIFLSDHGFRFGSYVYTYSGYVEERLPFFYMSVPKKFREMYPNQYNNLLKNAEKLTSAYQLYMTLQEILVLSGKNYSVKSSLGCPNCKSLFQEIQKDSSCHDVGIDNQWCSCNEYFAIPTDNIFIKEAANFIVNEVHRTLINGGSDFEQCAYFTIKNILSARTSDSSIVGKGVKEFIVTLEAEPPSVFQGHVTFNTTMDSPYFKLVGLVSKLDYYHDHSWCISDETLKRYCYCRDFFTLLWRMVHTIGRRLTNFITNS